MTLFHNQATRFFNIGMSVAEIARHLRISIADAYVLVGDIGDLELRGMLR